MNIVVCVKQTADTAATITVDGGKVSWGDTPLVLNPWDEFAVEEALRLREAHGGNVTAITVGPESAVEALRSALAMGADAAVRVEDIELSGADSLVVSAVLAAAIAKFEEVDLVLFGREAVDSNTGILSTQVARRLGWPSMPLVAAVHALDAGSGVVEVERMLSEGRQRVRASLPAVISVVKEINEPRYASFMGIRKASRVEVPVWTIGELSLGDIEPGVAWLPPEAAEEADVDCEFIEAEDPLEAARKLVKRLREEKVI